MPAPTPKTNPNRNINKLCYVYIVIKNVELIHNIPPINIVLLKLIYYLLYNFALYFSAKYKPSGATTV
jgi:hypothetical protein